MVISCFFFHENLLETNGLNCGAQLMAADPQANHCVQLLTFQMVVGEQLVVQLTGWIEDHLAMNSGGLLVANRGSLYHTVSLIQALN